MSTIFRCVHCKASLGLKREEEHLRCFSCGSEFGVFAGIPILVRDRRSIEEQIQRAKNSGRSDWYEASQAVQLRGPYRHHLKKRRLYLDRVLECYAKKREGLVGIDLGCGDGVNLTWLSAYVSRLYASDYNLLRLTRAVKTKAAEHIFMADVTDYPVNDDSFDLIFFNHVLEHIPDDIRALSEVYRILKAGGMLVLGVPNEGALLWQLAYKLQPNVLAGSDHAHFYTADSLREKCSNSGFRVLGITPIGWGVPHWSLDEKIRSYKWVDDLLETLGKTLIPSQSTSLYLIASK